MDAMRCLLFVLVLAACGDSDGKGGPKDAPDGTGDDAPVMIDAPGTGTDASFTMGASCLTTTGATNQVCCTGAQTACKAAADCPTQSFECDGPEDCNCCFGNGGQGGSTCNAAGQNCTGGKACHYDSDCGGMKCCPKMFTPSYKVCQAAC